MSTQTITQDHLAQYRQQIALEKEAKQSRPKKIVSPEVAEKTRQANYEEKLSKQASEKFAYSLSLIEPTPENLAKLIRRCSNDASNLERRAHKLIYWMRSEGWQLGTNLTLPEHISLLSTLLPDELRMSDGAFAKLYAVKKVKAPKKVVDVVERRCALAGRCMRAFARQGAVIPSGKGDYCSKGCRGRAQAISNRPQ